MSSADRHQNARLRGWGAGAVTAALAVAAHAGACGASPSTSELMLTLVIGVVVAAFAATHGARRPMLLAVLAGGQAATHLALSSVAPDPHESMSAVLAMLTAHAAAAVAAGVVLAAAERMYGPVATSIYAFLRAVFSTVPVETRYPTVTPPTFVGVFVARMLDASLQRRGPPAPVA